MNKRSKKRFKGIDINNNFHYDKQIYISYSVSERQSEINWNSNNYLLIEK